MGLGAKVVVLAASMDLPFAQQRWCGAAGAERVVTLSDHRDAALGMAYGVLIKELRLLARLPDPETDEARGIEPRACAPSSIAGAGYVTRIIRAVFWQRLGSAA